ncbi:flagellar biosynthesis regulator FlaF [Pikeienuella piscinae]|uniref:Flagellar biosynthesis regulator FlaF n=1 Tax=Pikeienuella piscinae TaxID=2748098 RepID=A0A7L5BZS2_9RHOB|nr:flagellar biosynthesis regulator FlaF [Pikeienuella piscinae]QIE56981.1 flagellar biosynthesis regulator FlaF [Pikeienuella piscinae]
MEIHQRAEIAYGDPRNAAKSPRQIEYQAFARITRALDAAAETDGPTAFPRLAAALHDNLKLWTVIAADVALEGNGLPEMLRARLFYLAEFTRAHTRKVLAQEENAAPLIELNTAIMRGLRQQSEAASCPA